MPYVAQCKMDVCSWIRERSRTVVLRNADGTLIRYEVMRGTSHHPDDNFPERYRPGLHIAWERKADSDYAFCSKVRPAYGFAADFDGRRRWVAHLLDLANLFGYNQSSAAAYMHACHRVGAGAELTPKRLRQFGYHAGTPSAQIILKRPGDIADRDVVKQAIARRDR